MIARVARAPLARTDALCASAVALGRVGLPRDDVLEDAEDGIDDLVVVVLDGGVVAGVDGGEEPVARVAVAPLEVEQLRDDRPARPREESSRRICCRSAARRFSAASWVRRTA